MISAPGSHHKGSGRSPDHGRPDAHQALRAAVSHGLSDGVDDRPRGRSRLGWLLAATVAVFAVLAAVGVSSAFASFGYLSQFGSFGSGNGQFNFPFGVAVDPSTTDVYVTDVGNSRVEKFDSSGHYLSQFGSFGDASFGDANGQFNEPQGVAVDPATSAVYIADTGNNRVEKFDSSGNYQSQFGSFGSGNGQFNSSFGVAVDPASSDVYVTDYGNNRVEKFDSSGHYLSQFGSTGADNGQFKNPVGVAVDPATSDVYVTDSGNGRVEKFDSNGNYLSQVGSSGFGDGQLGNPQGVAVDPTTSDVYVTDSGGRRVERFDSSGNFLSQFGSSGFGNGQFNLPEWVALDPATGDVYVADSGNNRVEKFGDQTDSTSTTVSCSPSTVAVGQTTSCTATVTDTATGGASTPTGSVSFTSDTAGGSFSSSGSCTLTGTGTAGQASCSASYTPGQVGSGSHGIAASYGGDPTHGISSGQTTVAVTTRSTSTSVSCSPSTVAVGQTTSCTATVTDIAAGTASTPTGSVSFTSDTAGGSFSSSGSCSLSPTGTAGEVSCAVSYTPGQVGSGTHTITANYGGDSAHATSTSAGTVTVMVRATSTTVSCSPGTVVVDQATTCTATVTDTTPSTTTPTGTVTFASDTVGKFSSGSCSLASTGTTGQASCSWSYTPGQVGSGVHTITASYGGDPMYAASTAVATVTVVKRTTSTAVSCKPAKPVICTATVTDIAPGAASTPTGTVSFTSSAAQGVFSPSNQCTLSATAADCSVSYQPVPGPQTITANYSGNSIHAASTGTYVPPPTSVSVNCRAIKSVICTATVTNTTSGTAPTGTVSFTSSAAQGVFRPSNQCTLRTISSTTCSVSYQPVPGAQTITANYSGDITHAASSGTYVPPPTSVSVNCRAIKSGICTATVTNTTSGTAPTGTVSFTSSAAQGVFRPSNQCTLRTISLTAASCSLSYQPVRGAQTITANYSGDFTHAASSGVTTVTA